MSSAIYLLPFLTNVEVWAFLFGFTTTAARLGASPAYVSAIPVLFSVSYLVTSLSLSRVSFKEETYRTLLYIATAGLVLFGAITYIFFPQIAQPHAYTTEPFRTLFHTSTLAQLYGIILLIGILAATFFVSFQVYMKVVASREGLVKNVSNYNISWPLGVGAGPFIAGFLYELNPRVPYVLPVVVGVGVIILLAFLQTFARTRPPRVETPPPSIDVPLRRVYFGWFIIFIAAFATLSVRMLYADSGKHYFTPSVIGVLVGVSFFVQSITSYFLRYAYRFFETPLVFFVTTVLGIFFLVVLGFMTSVVFVVIGFVLLGIFSAIYYYFPILYSNGNEHRARNVGVNEMLVGLGGVVGPLAIGSAANAFSYSLSYAFVGGISLALFLLALFMLQRAPKEALAQKEE